MTESRRNFRASDLQVSDLIVVETPTEAWLVLEVDLSKRHEQRKVRVLLLPTHKHPAEPEVRIVNVDFAFPLHYQLLRRDTKTSKLEEVES
ncbi:hypothetical protein HN588_03440 [Candidatus Bathyarchaeota archaeon]|jgi:hypothetical protein|nr:hypothetical protein [Candidatus Bathyarchaeota archaeon]